MSIRNDQNLNIFYPIFFLCQFYWMFQQILPLCQNNNELMFNNSNIMSKQSNLSQTISNVNKYMKNLKQQKVLVNNNPQSFSNSYLAFDHSLSEIPHSHPSTMAFHKAKSKAEVEDFFKNDSPLHAKSSHNSKDKKEINMSLKMMGNKKDIQSQNEREHAFNKSHGRAQIKHLSNLLASSFGTKEIEIKKNGHSHTYTNLNDMDSDKFSEVDSNLSTKNIRPVRMRHSKSPSKQRHIEHNNTSYGDQDGRPYHNRIHVAEKDVKQHQQKKVSSLQSSFLLEQIFRLQQSLKQYKLVLLQMKHKYLQMQQRLKQKALNDHYIDVLKQKIQALQDKNHQLNFTLQQKEKHLNECEQVFINKIKMINQYYKKHEQQWVQLKSENSILRQLLMIEIEPTNSTHASQKIQKTKKETQKSPYLETVCKSVQNFEAKWN